MKPKQKLLFISAVLIFAFSFFFVEPVKAVNTDPVIKATDYQMNVRLNTQRNQLTEHVTIDVQNNSSTDLKQLLIRNIAYGVLRYDAKHWPEDNFNKHTLINSIQADNQNLTYTFGRDQSNIYVNLNTPLKPGEKEAVTVNATTDIPNRKDRFGFHDVMGGKIYNLSFCFPYLSDYRNGKWNYHRYSDEGENRNSAISDYHVTFIAPKAYTVAASGSHTTTDSTTTIDAPNTRDLAIVASNRFKVSHAKADGITINNFYVVGKNAQNARDYNALTKQTAIDSLRLFDKKLGHYPYKNLDITEYPFEDDTGGMEYSGLIMISDENFLKKERATTVDYDELVEDVSHEVAHEWFFNTVGSDEFEEPWLDEGMAEFFEEYCYDLANSKSKKMFFKMTHTHMPKNYVSKMNKQFNTDIKFIIKQGKKIIINYPMDKIPAGTDESTLDYEVAKIFYAELLVTMGQKKFYQAMRDYVHTYYFKQATGKDFLAIIRKYDDSKKVDKVINRFINPEFLN